MNKLMKDGLKVKSSESNEVKFKFVSILLKSIFLSQKETGLRSLGIQLKNTLDTDKACTWELTLCSKLQEILSKATKLVGEKMDMQDTQTKMRVVSNEST